MPAGTSEATIFVRVKQLQKIRVLKAFRAIVDPRSVGKNVTAFALIKAEPKSFPKMLAQLRSFDDICEIHDVTGAYYSIEGVAGTETVIVLRTIKEETSIKLWHSAEDP